MKAIQPFSQPEPGEPPRRRGDRAKQAFITFAALLLGAQASAGAGVPVEPGDVLRIAISEAPEIGRDAAKVDADGRIMLPRLGAVAVAGSDLDAVRENIEAALISHDIIRAPTVLVEVVSYRPFYVGGAVTRPGAIPFEPGLTVRHALILAGGLDRTDGSDRMSAPELVELKAKWRTSNFGLVQVKSRIAVLEAELSKSAAPDFSRLDARVAFAGDREAIVSLDTDLFDDRMAEWSADQAHLRDVVKLIDLEIDVLSKQAGLQEQERELQRDQVQKAKILVEKGVMPLPRLQELEREASRLSRDLLDNQAYTARARQNKQTQMYQLEATDTKWRIDIRDELRDAMADRMRIEAENEVLAAAMLAAGLALVDDDAAAAPEPRVAIHRTTAGKAETTTARMDTEIRPGDVLEVAIAKAPRA